MSPSHDDSRSVRRRRLRDGDVNTEASIAAPAPDPFPATPASIEDSGLDFGFLADLALKTVYADTSCTTQRAAERLGLPIGIIDLLLQHLYRERLIEIRETIAAQNRRYAMLDRGWEGYAGSWT